MTTQRDRLAAVLADACAGIGCDGTEDVHFASADALLARGVRVVDGETLAAALRHVYGFQVAPDPVAQARQDAEWVLAALDGEADR